MYLPAYLPAYLPTYPLLAAHGVHHLRIICGLACDQLPNIWLPMGGAPPSLYVGTWTGVDAPRMGPQRPIMLHNALYLAPLPIWLALDHQTPICSCDDGGRRSCFHARTCCCCLLEPAFCTLAYTLA